MAAKGTIKWPGKSGKEYKYWIYSIDTTFSKNPANYIFVKETSPGKWRTKYIGQTKNLADRLSSHEKEDCAKKKGAKHIHAHKTSGGLAVRRKEEKDLIDRWNPPCNEQ